ncbi:thermophilic desulfurizing enzyme family protein, partial [Bisporella sp. PMI_857]
TALAIGAFATTLTTLSLSLMEWRGVTTTNAYIGNFFFIAGLGMVISAQWELVLGNSFGYTVLSAFGFFYAGFGAIITPGFGVLNAYGSDSVEYNNALGYFVIMWTVLNTFFLIGSLPINLVYIGIFFFVELAFGLVAASYFATADGKTAQGVALKKAGGVFAFLAGLLGYYTVGHLILSSSSPSIWRLLTLAQNGDVALSRCTIALTCGLAGLSGPLRFHLIMSESTFAIPSEPANLKKKRKIMAPSVTEAPSNDHRVAHDPIPSKVVPKPTTDPAVYDIHHQKFISDGLPASPEAWVERSRAVAEVLAADAAARDIENKSPKAEIALLKSAGLLKVLGPTKYGGGGQSWEVGYKVIREVAKGDGSLGMLLGYHLLWSTTANVVGTEEQKEKTQKLIIENNYFVGGAVNPRDNDLNITDQGDHLVFEGFKNFNTGGVVSDLTVLEGVFSGTEHHIFAFVPTVQPGIQFAHNWNNVGLRLTESGSVKIDKVKVPWTDALGWDTNTRLPDPAVLSIPFATLLLPTIQLVFSNFYLGIALGSLSFAAKYTNTSTRAWPYGGDNKDSPTEEFYILERYGNFFAHLRAAEALADRAGQEIAKVYERHGGKRSVNERERGEVAEWVASTKVVTTDTALRVTAGVFEVTGSRATGRKVGLDRFWRDVRTHSLHDPVAYKNREVGEYVLLNKIPEPTWYT